MGLVGPDRTTFYHTTYRESSKKTVKENNLVHQQKRKEGKPKPDSALNFTSI